MTRWICGVFLVIVLIGCSSQRQSEHSVVFVPGRMSLDRFEQKKLYNFVVSSSPRDCFELDGPRSGSGYFDPVTAVRVAELTRHLNSLGIHTNVPRQPFWAYNGPVSISVRTCRGKAA